ncbi:hypothetical protein J5N97_001370 [Dioscorea zingiberensis]|uniref:Peroxiredoxin-like 2A n=1 Tax=Dioscorea zingiberensis TaxID=325984 RepID=A0A9D5H2E2_9LILI|nr:hypothetical protein J5N97_001370 [Dioscorea zingiberensis]
MASFAMEDFLGDGILNGLIPKLLAGGWDDVPTIKMMNAEDMDHMKLTQQQKDALELRSYLHDRALMEYADRLEASGKSLVELLNSSTVVLSSQFGMKRGHVARFVDRASACRISMPPNYTLPARQKRASLVSKSEAYDRSITPRRMQMARSPLRGSSKYEMSIEQSVLDYKIKEGYVFKGVVAAEPVETWLCGCIQPPPIVDDVAPYASIENISVQKITPEYKVGMERLLTVKAPPMKASIYGGINPLFYFVSDAQGTNDPCPIYLHLFLFVIDVLHPLMTIESEVKDFWPRYWGGIVVLDRNLDFFKALGGGELLKDKFVSGFLLNRRAIANYQRARATGLQQNFIGEGEIKGGLFIVASGRNGIAYQFIERNFGDWAPISEVVEICSKIQNLFPNQEESFTTSFSMA